MEFLLIYIYFVLQNLSSILLFGLIGLLVLFGATLVFCLDEPSHVCEDFYKSHTVPWFKRLIYILVIPGFILTILVPSKEDIAWIVGGGITLNIAQSEEARQLPDNVLNAANQFLESIKESEEDETE